MARPRLVHVTTTDMSLDWLLGPQLAAFAAAGFEVIGVSAPGPHVAALEAMGVGHVALTHATRAVAPGEDLLALAELARVLVALGPDIVHTHNPKPGIYGRLAARAVGVAAVVNTVHGLYALPEDPWPRRAVVYAAERLAAACSDRELVQNPEDLAVLARLGVPASRLRLLGNGVDLGRFAPASVPGEVRERVRAELGAGPGDVLVGAVGRLVREKGLGELIDAAASLAVTNPTARVVVVGPDDPSKGDALGSEERKAAEQAGVRFAGRREDMAEVYAALDIYVLASHREGYPRSAMEAAAMGRPVVATDIRGCRQVVAHGRTGLLVPVRDPVALADALASLVVDEGMRRAMGSAARQRALLHFDQARVIETTLGVYDELLARPPRPGRLIARRWPQRHPQRHPQRGAGGDRGRTG